MKTIRETIISFPGLGDMDDVFLNRVLALRGLNADEEYSVEKDKSVCLSAADLYRDMVCLPDFTENKLSIKYSRRYFQEAARRLYMENGEPENAFKIGKRIIVRGKAGDRW